ncbi:hypothetical protein EVAR_102385_1 [Eumeta japonica]|uniref:Uncharacterized protein n=1 Tax=Eumeta variegata TaxID=151549 RepID=A0A4C1SB40_EUMVA|nr:hypothetical protein EVAR_102385_1 [Eumeta japonica]
MYFSVWIPQSALRRKSMEEDDSELPRSRRFILLNDPQLPLVGAEPETCADFDPHRWRTDRLASNLSKSVKTSVADVSAAPIVVRKPALAERENVKVQDLQS